jgi:hypothetical protein
MVWLFALYADRELRKMVPVASAAYRLAGLV